MPEVNIDVSDVYFTDCSIFVNYGKEKNAIEVRVPELETMITVSKQQMEQLIQGYYNCILTTKPPVEKKEGNDDLGAADNLD